MIRLRITAEGTIQGLYSEEVDWPELGALRVHRASHVEFCRRRQQWYVQAGTPRTAFRRILQTLTGLAFGEILHWAETRKAALAWEHAYFAPGGRGWPERGQARGQAMEHKQSARRDQSVARIWPVRSTTLLARQRGTPQWPSARLWARRRIPRSGTPGARLSRPRRALRVLDAFPHLPDKSVSFDRRLWLPPYLPAATENPPMELLQALIGALAWLFGWRQDVPGHRKQQAYGPRWSQHRPRHIHTYRRKRPR